MKGKRKRTQLLIERFLRRSLPWIALPGLLLAMSAPTLVAQETQKRVLVLYAQRKEAFFPQLAEKIYQKKFSEGLGGQLDYHSEYIDVTRFPEPEYQQALSDFLRHKYARKRFDLVIATSDTCIEFVERYGASLFPDSPVVFVGGENPKPLPNSTGVSTRLDLKSTINLALELQPRTKRIFVISGSSTYDKYYEDLARRQFQEFEGRVVLTYLHGLPLRDLEKAVANLPPDSIIYGLSVTEDVSGNSLLGMEVLDNLAPVANAPIYGWIDTEIGHGIVGGSLISIEKVSEQMAELGLRVLRGEKPENIPVTELQMNVPEFDWRQLRRWGINENKLPPGSIVRFKQPTFWEQYKWRIVGVISLCIVEALLIVGLLINRSRLRQAENESERLAQLAEAERRHLDEMVSSVPGIVWETRFEPDGKTRKTSFVSDYIEQMLGYSIGEWLSTPDFALAIMADEDRERIERETEKILESGKEGILQFRWVAKDGRILDVEARMAAIWDETGKLTGLRGVTMDITDRKLAETARRESELKLSGVVSSAMDAIISIDESQRIILFNDAAEKMFGYSADEVIGQSVDQLIPERLQKVHREHVRAFGETKVTKRSMGRLEPIYGHRSDGTDFPIEASISHAEMNGHKYYTVILRDITERQRAEQELKASESRFRNMADTAPVMIWMSGPDKLCTYFNQGWLDFTGRTMEQELGNGWSEGVHADDFARCLDTYNLAFDRREPFKMEYRLRRTDGEYRWIYDCGTPRFSAAEEFLGYIGSCIDIGDRKEAEEALQEAHAEVSELKNQLQAENIVLQEEIKLAHKVDEIIGESNALKYVLFKVEQVAQTDTSVLILGETGTGKELVARAIHEQSKRKDRPLIKVNCAALSASLIESELFGHEKGAFTGALARKIGRFELANGATLFLDEIGELPLELQSKLLRVIQEGEFERLGSSLTIKVDVRIIAATNRNMKAAIDEGKFREDLWYRLNVFPITVPPLRQRKQDIPALVEHFVKGMSTSFGKSITSISAPTLKKLQDHSWPGNIRELANVIERAVINAQGPVLHIVDQFEQIRAEESSVSNKTLEEVEREYIVRILDGTAWRIEGQHGAASILGLNPSTLRTRMVKLGIHKNISSVAVGRRESP